MLSNKVEGGEESQAQFCRVWVSGRAGCQLEELR